MSHGFAVRIGHQAELTARAARMEAAGWQVARPDPGTLLAWRGAGAHHRAGALSFCGLVFLDNRPGLCAALGMAPDAAAGLSDLALLAAAHAARGAAFTELVSGSFAVVIHDHDTGRSTGYRDHLGVYPFWYMPQDGALCAGSDLRAVLHLSGAALQPDAIRIADFIRGDEIDRDRTAFAGLARLPAAHHLSADSGGVSVARYWELTLPPLQPAEGAPARLRAVLDLATAARTIPGTGAMLSGGLDSTTLVGLAAQTAHAQGSAALRTLSFVYGADKAYDESTYIDEANAAFGTQGHAITVTAAPDLNALGPLIEEQMDLFLAPGLQKSRRIYAEARDLGLSALIDGHGGDEVISHGYARMVELAASRSWGKLWGASRAVARLHGTSLSLLYFGHIVRYGGLPRRSLLRRVMARIVRWQAAAPTGGDPGLVGAHLIAPDLRARIDADSRYAPVDPLATAQDIHDVARSANLRDVTNPLIERAFEVLHGSATAAGVLPLYPFYDRRVVALCLALPAETRLRDGQTRWVLREATRGLLPERIRTRHDKADFSAEITAAIWQFYQARGADPFHALAAFLYPDRAEALLREILAGTVTEPYALKLMWRLAVLLNWSDALVRWQSQQAEGRLI